MGFEVFPHHDLKRADFFMKVIEFSQKKNHGDIVIVVVMSHGESGGTSGKIITSDGLKVDVEDDIIRHFNNATLGMLRYLLCALYLFYTQKCVSWVY